MNNEIYFQNLLFSIITSLFIRYYLFVWDAATPDLENPLEFAKHKNNPIWR